MNSSQKKVITETKFMALIVLLFAIIYPFLNEYPYLKYAFLALALFVPRDAEVRNKGIIEAVIKKYPLFKYYFFGYMFFIAYWVFATLKEAAHLSEAERVESHEYLWVMAGLAIPCLVTGQFYKYEKASNDKT